MISLINVSLASSEPRTPSWRPLPGPHKTLNGSGGPVAPNEPIQGRPTYPEFPGSVVHRGDLQTVGMTVEQVPDCRLAPASLLHPGRSSKLSSAIVVRQPFCNVAGQHSQISGSRPSKFSFQAALSHFNGNCKSLIFQERISHSKQQHDTGRFDLAIGNPPFSDRVVPADPVPRALGLRLHDYFIARSIARLRPGGIALLFTSTGTMDKASAAAREHIASMADLVGAVRLPRAACARARAPRW